MKKTTYECRRCGKSCNGSGISFEMLQVETRGVILLSMSTDMEHYPDHACGQEHTMQIISEALTELKRVPVVGAGSPRPNLAEETGQ